MLQFNTCQQYLDLFFHIRRKTSTSYPEFGDVNSKYALGTFQRLLAFNNIKGDAELLNLLFSLTSICSVIPELFFNKRTLLKERRTASTDTRQTAGSF